MVNKKATRNIFILLFLVIFLTGISFYGSQLFSIITDEVFIPQYLTAECNTRAEHLSEVQITSHTDEGTWYHCNTDEAGKWVPIHPGVQCEYEIKDFITATIYICDGFTEDEDDLDSDKCIKSTELQAIDKSFSVDAGDSIFINTNRVFGDANLDVKYPAYGLRVRQVDGLVRQTSASCELSSLSSQFHTIDAGTRTEVKPDSPLNVVSGLQRVITTQLVSLSDVRGGETIYISRPGFYFLIKIADDGFKYVDTTREFQDSSIECIPRTTGCSDEAKIVELEQQSCGQFSGAITGRAPVSGDSSVLCKYECSGGQLRVTSDCITIPTSCPPETPLFDSATGECVAATSLGITGGEFNPIPLFILIGTLLILGFIFLAARQQGRI